MKTLTSTLLKAGALLAAALAATPAMAWDICWTNCDFTRTKYPIVLEHGLAGFNELGGVLPYWNGIPENLRRSEEHTSELQSLMRISYAVFCLTKNKTSQLSTHITYK